MDFDSRDLSLGLAHWGYELEMCAACAVQLELHAELSTIRNACLESHLLHARSLTEFFLEAKGKSGKDDDMRPGHFAPGWHPSPAAEVERVTARKETINKHLAHLTWRRVSDQKPIDWAYRQMAQDVVTIAQAWAEHVNRSDRTVGRLALDYVRTARRILGDDDLPTTGPLVACTN